MNDHPKVIFAYLFGCLARRKPSPMSDIDIAIYLLRHTDVVQEKMEILGRLIELLETDEIDLTILNSASLPLVARIIEKKVILVDKEPFLRHGYESLILMKYFDFSIKETEMLKRRNLLGRQEPCA